MRGSTGSRASCRPSVGQLVVVIDRAELVQRLVAVADRAIVRRIEERKILRPSPRRNAFICRMTLARFVRRISGSVKRGARVEIFLAEYSRTQTPALDTAAAALALVGAGLRDRLDRQALHFAARASSG